MFLVVTFDSWFCPSHPGATSTIPQIVFFMSGERQSNTGVQCVSGRTGLAGDPEQSPVPTVYLCPPSELSQ